MYNPTLIESAERREATTRGYKLVVIVCTCRQAITHQLELDLDGERCTKFAIPLQQRLLPLPSSLSDRNRWNLPRGLGERRRRRPAGYVRRTCSPRWCPRLHTYFQQGITAAWWAVVRGAGAGISGMWTRLGGKNVIKGSQIKLGEKKRCETCSKKYGNNCNVIEAA
jgi:hypothetical protein